MQYQKGDSHRFSLAPPPSVFMYYSSRMSSQRENQPLVNGSSSSNAAATRPSLNISAHLVSLLDLIARKLGRLEPLMEKQPDLQQITIIITLDKRGKPRTVILRTEAKSELSS
jgi:hypothetical protein